MSVKPPMRTSCDHSIYVERRFGWIMLGAAVLTLCVLIAGCSTPIPVTRVVHVHDNTKALDAYKKGIKDVLETRCPATRARATVATVNDLIDSNDKGDAAATCRQSVIDKALKVKAPPPAT